jgi:RNA polymerase sigma factor (sigma-70 family)
MRTKRDDMPQPNRLYASLNRFISATVLLSAEDEHTLACDKSPEARDRLILSQLRLVKSIAFRFRDYGIDVKDCFDQGVVGLIKAVDRYDPIRGRLATFAHHFIIGEILCYLNTNQKLLHLPSPLRRAVNRFCRTRRQLGEGTTDADIAAAMNLSDGEVSFLRECAEYRIESLDAPLEDSADNATLGDTTGSIDPGFAEIETRVSVEQLLSHLSKVECEVIRFRYKTTQLSKPQANVDDTVSFDDHNHAPDQDHNHSHDHDHSHDTAPDFRTVQRSPNDNANDWRDESPYDAQRPKTDPWKKLDVQHTETEASTGSSKDSEVYPPPNWHLTKDPALRAEYFHAQLINQFGDIPEVHTLAAYQRKQELGIPVTIDEYIESLEARYHLWRNKSILRALESLRKEKRK